jgi:hypothetical protein
MATYTLNLSHSEEDLHPLATSHSGQKLVFARTMSSAPNVAWLSINALSDVQSAHAPFQAHHWNATDVEAPRYTVHTSWSSVPTPLDGLNWELNALPSGEILSKP